MLARLHFRCSLSLEADAPIYLSVLTSHYALRLTDCTRSSVRNLRMQTHGSNDVHHHVEAPAVVVTRLHGAADT